MAKQGFHDVRYRPLNAHPGAPTMVESADILVVDDDTNVLELLAHMLRKRGWTVRTAETGEEGLDELRAALPDAVLLDMRMPNMSGFETLKAMRARLPRLPVVFLSGSTDAETIVEAMRLGAFDYVVKPPEPMKLVATLSNAVRQHRLVRRVALLEREAEGRSYPGLLGQSPVMRQLYRALDSVADTDVSLLLQGESGTGKEQVARAIHRSSSRHEGLFCVANCAALTSENEDSEIFGVGEGAPSGSGPARPGWFERAHGGTLYLDSLVDLPPSAQGKLLRVLQDRSLYRRGGIEAHGVDVRLVASGDQKLREAVTRGAFREDLFFRVSSFEIEVPPLRTRGDDVVELAHHFPGLELSLVEQRQGCCQALSPSAQLYCQSRLDAAGVRCLYGVPYDRVLEGDDTPPASPVKVFEGSARAAGMAFPRHFNVGIALSLAGIGPDRTEVEVWANNDIPGTIHEVYVVSNAIKLTLKSENLPSPDNPRTSSSVAPSVIAALRSLVSSVQVGS